MLSALKNCIFRACAVFLSFQIEKKNDAYIISFISQVRAHLYCIYGTEKMKFAVSFHFVQRVIII